jgi:hypothetical protein
MAQAQGSIVADEEAVTLTYRPDPGSGLARLDRFNGGVAVQVRGTWTGTLDFEASVDGVGFEPLLMLNTSDGLSVDSTTGNGIWRAELVGTSVVRVLASDTITGEAMVTVVATEG